MSIQQLDTQAQLHGKLKAFEAGDQALTRTELIGAMWTLAYLLEARRQAMQ